MGREPYSGPEPFRLFPAHVRQVWDAEKYMGEGGPWLYFALQNGLAAVVLGTMSLLRVTKLVWWLTRDA